MKKQFTISFYLGSLLVVSVSPAADLKQSKFTQVVNDVRIVSAADNFEKPAVVNAIFNVPDLVRTGVASRAELVAEDNTITRVGANTIFSFDPANRTIDLQQGSLLFHSPKGKGGGTIRTGSATASVLGTTIMVATTSDGGFKVLVLEGHAAIKFLNGLQESLGPGQMTFVLHDGRPAAVINIRLGDLTSNSKLVQGFTSPLPSMPLIQQQIADQNELIRTGLAQDTGLLVGDVATPTTVQVVDVNTIKDNQSSDEPPANQPTGGGTPPPTAVVLNSSTLPSQYIFNSSQTFGSFTFPAPGFLAPSNLPNITISSPTIDLSSYNSATSFGFLVPNGTLATNNSVTFTGLSSTAALDLFAQQFSFASGSTVEADVGLFNLEPQTATTLTNVTILDKFQNSTQEQSYGEVNITSPSTLSLVGSTVQGSFVLLDGVTGVSITKGSAVTASFGNVSVIDGGGINISGSAIKATQGLLFGDSNSGDVSLSATGAAVNIGSGTTISAPSLVSIISDTGVSIAGASTITSGGFLDILASTTPSDSISVTGNPTLTSGPSSNLILQASASLTVNGATINTDPTFGQVFMDATAASGLITVKNASISANNLTLNSGDGILMDGTGGTLTLAGTGASPQVNLTAAGGSGGSLTVNNADFTSFSTVNMAAHTINLTGVAFSSNLANPVNLKSFLGLANFGSSTPGYVNFVANNTWGGASITANSLPGAYNIHISTSGF